MSRPATAIVRDLFDRIENEGVEAALELVAADGVLVVPPEASAEPDTYKGHDGVRRYFAGFEGVLDDVHFDLVEVDEASPDTVLAEMRMSGRGAATEIPVAQTVFIVVTIRDGRVARIMPHADRPAALAALGSGAR